MGVKNCTKCGSEYVKKQSVSRKTWAKSKYCSRRCTNLSKIGLPSWSKGTKGVVKAWNNGKTCPQFQGRNNGTWKGTDDKYWKRQCLIRDDHTCVQCGYREPEIMEVDHVKPKMIHPELRWTLENLQTLCPNCHRRKTIEDKKTIALFKRQKLN